MMARISAFESEISHKKNPEYQQALVPWIKAQHLTELAACLRSRQLVPMKENSS
jgi:hypothetical protein